MSMRFCALVLMLMMWGSTAVAEEPLKPEFSDPVVKTSEEPVPFEKPNILGTAGAVVPGLMLHGSGHWIAGDHSTGYKLMLTQLTGMVMAVGGIAILGVTGADPRFTPPGALIAIYGVGLFWGSWLADLYGVVAPEEGFGKPLTRQAWIGYRGGYRYVVSPVFVDRAHAATVGLSYRTGRFGLDFDAATVVTSGESEVGTDLRLRLSGPRPDKRSSDGTFSDLVVGYDYRDFDRGQFETHTVDLYWSNRWDLRRFAPSLRGAFVIGGAGVALQTIAYDDLPNIFSTLLLSRMGFGIDLGASATGWGEALLYYDHRHDGPAAGFKANGLGSGNAGHFGASWRQHVWGGWGFFAGTEIGSAWVLRTGIERQFGGTR